MSTHHNLDIEQNSSGVRTISEAKQTRYFVDRQDCKYYFTEDGVQIKLPHESELPVLYVDILEPISMDSDQHKVKCRLYLQDNIVVIGYIWIRPVFPFKISGYRLEFDGRYNNPAFM